MPTLFASQSEEERRKLFTHVCLPVRVVVYTLTAVLLILFPRIVGPILIFLSIIAIIWMSYRNYTATGWWLRWPHILIWVIIGVISAISYKYPMVAYAIIPVLVIDWVMAVIMYHYRFK